MKTLYHRIFDTKKVVIFDVDGTLVDVMDAHTQAYIDTIHEITGVKVKRFEDITKHYGIQNQETMRRVLRDHDHTFTEDTIDRLVDRRGDKMAAPTTPISAANILPGVEALLQRLQGEGKLIATITGNSRKVGEAVIERSTIGRYFKIRVFGNDTENGRPLQGRHEMIALAVKKLEAASGKKFEPNDILVVGDMVPDIQGAQKAGMEVLVVATGGVPLETLNVYHPTFGVRSFTELEED